MTSVDSGVETGNDSNDSLVAQHENFAVRQVSGNTTMNSSITGGQTEGQEQEQGNASLEAGPAKSLILPVATICPSLENSSSSENQSIVGPGTSGPLVLCSSRESAKVNWSCISLPEVLEFRIPTMYGRYEQLSSSAELLKSSTYNYRKMRSLHAVRKNYRFAWKEFQGLLSERKMRLAAATNNIEMMQRLLSSGVSPNNQDDQGKSPLHLASCRGYTEMVRLLLEYGANPNQRDCIGNTPLHLAAVTSKISVVTLLLKAGTDVLSSDQHGYNPLQLAQAKLRMMQNWEGPDMNRMKDEVNNVVGMLLAYLQKQKDAREQVEALSTFCSRLSLASTSDQVQSDVRDLLANINSLSLTS